MKFSYYICNVFKIKHAPKNTKKGENKENLSIKDYEEESDKSYSDRSDS